MELSLACEPRLPGEQLYDLLGLRVGRLSGNPCGALAVACELRLLARGGGPLLIDVGSLPCALCLRTRKGCGTQQTSLASVTS